MTSQPNAYTTLVEIKGVYYVQTTLTMPTHAELLSWWRANQSRILAKGALVRKYTRRSGEGKAMFLTVTPAEYWRDGYCEMRIVWPVADQEAAAKIEDKRLFGAYSTHRSTASYRDDLRALTALAA